MNIVMALTDPSGMGEICLKRREKRFDVLCKSLSSFDIIIRTLCMLLSFVSWLSSYDVNLQRCWMEFFPFPFTNWWIIYKYLMNWNQSSQNVHQWIFSEHNLISLLMKCKSTIAIESHWNFGKHRKSEKP